VNTVGGSARLLLLAPPGAGKSTQGRLLGQAYGVPHISTGELMRDEMSAQSPVGRRVAGFVRRGELVPDDIVIDLVLRRLTEPVEIDGFVLDGFPRTLAQAEVA
jgi:adenylate kinase